MTTEYFNRLTVLRLHDLIAKTAHVRLKDTLRVLIALKAASDEYGLKVDSILDLPYSEQKPSPIQAQQCELAYCWMHENSNVAKYLFEIEQLY